MNHGINSGSRSEHVRRRRSPLQRFAVLRRGDGAVCESLPACGVGSTNRVPLQTMNRRRCSGRSSSFGPNQFFKASERTLDSRTDLRWGPTARRSAPRPSKRRVPDRPWHITEPTDYSGYFSSGSAALAIARYRRAARNAPWQDAFAFDGLASRTPTTDSNDIEPLRTANFMTQEDIGGSQTDFINDVELRNDPIRPSRGGALASLFYRRSASRSGASINSRASGSSIPSRSWASLTARRRARRVHAVAGRTGQPRIEGADLDFRDEAMAQIFDRGDPAPKRSLTFNIEVTDQGTTTGPAFRERRTFKDWRKIGTLTFEQRRHLAERRLRYSLQPSHVAHGSHGSADGDAPGREKVR